MSPLKKKVEAENCDKLLELDAPWCVYAHTRLYKLAYQLDLATDNKLVTQSCTFTWC